MQDKLTEINEDIMHHYAATRDFIFLLPQSVFDMVYVGMY